jgi:Zinc carboxypeptidase
MIQTTVTRSFMKKFFSSFLILWICSSFALSQPVDLNYYLPKISYDPSITTPKKFLGFEVGDRHASHDQLYFYMKQLASESPRIKWVEYARSYEGRPLICLIFTSAKNQGQLETLRLKHLQWINPDGASPLSIDEVPLVLYQGYSIHGNEASGSNASLAMAYYLAAGQGQEIDELLDKTIILFDPSFNPDGMQRFSTWVNAHKSETAVTDAATREFNEPWPRGRTNHYWFDLNRDWMPQQLPESKGRVKLFHQWKPNILTDHHEMGSNATFFFMPGEPTRVNPNTPKMNQELTNDIAKFHSESLNSIGSLYYTREGYDDYYYGKGSTYPDVNGAIGILFEQASSRGHAQMTTNGLLTFPFAIRNHVRASFSTYKASVILRNKLLTYQKDFYKNANKEADQDTIKGYVFSAGKDQGRMNQFLDILFANQINVYQLKENKNGLNKDESYVVPCNQLQYRLIKGMFEKRTSFTDSLFYDISAWTYPLAFNLDYVELKASDKINSLLGDEYKLPLVHKTITFLKSEYAYAIDWNGYYAPKLVYALLDRGIRLRLMHEETTMSTSGGVTKLKRGTLILPVQNQSLNPEQLYSLLQSLATENLVTITSVHTGLALQGVDLGSPSTSVIQKPKIAMIVGDGVDANDAGEVWHLLDTRMSMPLSLMDVVNLTPNSFDQYTTLVLVDGTYTAINANQVTALKSWVSKGGNIIAIGRSIQWCATQGLANVIIKPTVSSFDIKSGEVPMRPYAMASADVGSDALAGAIFNTKFDATHPLAYGYNGNTLPLFKSTRIYLENPKNAYAGPFRYTSDPLLSGYVTKVNLDLIKSSAAVIVCGSGDGKVICIPDNLNFRAFWYGTNKLFMNAIFFASAINGSTVQRGEE